MYICRVDTQVLDSFHKALLGQQFLKDEAETQSILENAKNNSQNFETLFRTNNITLIILVDFKIQHMLHYSLPNYKCLERKL